MNGPSLNAQICDSCILRPPGRLGWRERLKLSAYLHLLFSPLHACRRSVYVDAACGNNGAVCAAASVSHSHNAAVCESSQGRDLCVNRRDDLTFRSYITCPAGAYLLHVCGLQFPLRWPHADFRKRMRAETRPRGNILKRRARSFYFTPVGKYWTNGPVSRVTFKFTNLRDKEDLLLNICNLILNNN